MGRGIIGLGGRPIDDEIGDEDDEMEIGENWRE